MSTFTISANQLAYIIAGDSSWRWNSAFQGTYGQGNHPRVGVLMFSSLRNTIKWSDMKVNEVRLTMAFGSAGGGSRKTIGLYATTRNTVGGSASAMLGANIGQVYTNVSAWKNTDTLYFNSTTNITQFTAFQNWIENGTTTGLAIFMSEHPAEGATYSRNYLIVESASLYIDYELKGSNGTIDPSIVEAKSSLTLAIDPIMSEEPVSHTAEFSLGTQTSGVISIAAGVTEYTYTIPVGWLNEIPNETSGSATCVLSTFEGGEPMGYRTLPFTVAVPASYTPVINSFSVKRYTSYIDDQSQTQYIESLGGNHVWVNIDAYIDRDSGDNPGTAQLRYYQAGDEENAQTVNITWSNNALVVTQDRTLIASEISLTSSWVFELIVSNGHTTIIENHKVDKSWAAFHVAGTGYGVGIGMYSDGTQASPKFQVAWPSLMFGGIEGVTNYSTDEKPTGGTWIDGSPLYSRTFVVPITQANIIIQYNIGNDIDLILNYSGVLVTTNGSQRAINWYYSSSSYCGVSRYYQNTNMIDLIAGETGTAYVTILYTKVAAQSNQLNAQGGE